MFCYSQIRMQQSSNWQESAARLIETQENAAKAAQTAYSQLARVMNCLHQAKTMFFRIDILVIPCVSFTPNDVRILVLVTFNVIQMK